MATKAIIDAASVASPGFGLFDVVELTQDIPDTNLKTGTQGAIVEELRGGKAFLVEFCDENGVPYETPALRPDQLRLITPIRDMLPPLPEEGNKLGIRAFATDREIDETLKSAGGHQQ